MVGAGAGRRDVVVGLLVAGRGGRRAVCYVIAIDAVLVWHAWVLTWASVAIGVVVLLLIEPAVLVSVDEAVWAGLVGAAVVSVLFAVAAIVVIM